MPTTADIERQFLLAQLGSLAMPGDTLSDLRTKFYSNPLGLLRGVNGSLTAPSVMATPPAVTIGAANAGSTIANSVRYDGTNKSINFLSAGYRLTNIGGWPNSVVSANLTSSQPAEGRLRLEFETDADVLEIQVQATAAGTLSNYRLWVDGQQVTSALQTGLSAGGALYMLKIAFTGRGNRRIMLEGNSINFIGVYLPPTAVLWKSARRLGPRAVWLGDSFSEGSGGNGWSDSWETTAGRILGWDVCPSGVGSTGYLADGGGGGKVKYRDRIANDVTPLNPDIIVVTGGINDIGTYSASQVATESDALFKALKASNPSAVLVVCGPNNNRGVSSAGQQTYVRDAIQASAAASNAYFIDPIGYPTVQGWITGTGHVGAVTGDGNADLFTGGDGVHPTQAGHDYLGRRFAAAITALIP